MNVRDAGSYDSYEEIKIRKAIGLAVAYAESGYAFDPGGRYLCRKCSFFGEPRSCRAVAGRIAGDTGSCRLWTRAKDPQPPAKRLDQARAEYGERPEAKGFGCSRCEYAAKAKARDDEGRNLWCGLWGLHVIPDACCAEEDGPDMIEGAE